MTQTDSDGRFVFDHLPAGAYTVTATKEGLVMSPASLQVVLADSNRQDLAYSAASAGQALGFRRYFAEGATSAVFNTVFALFNPTTRASRVRLSFLRDGGGAVISDQSLLPGASVRVSPREFAGMAEAEFSTLIESSEPVIASRHMTWDDRGYGSHNESSIAEPRSTWYLAEGVTSSDFDLFYLLQNPWSAPVTVEIDYLRPAPAQELRKPYVIPPFSRRTVWVNQEGSGLASAEVSAVVRTAESQPIVVERAVYVRGSRTFEGGHASAGIAAPALEWFLAEGATGSYFDTFVLIVNPDERAATLRMDYLLGDGSSVTKEHTVPGRSRYTVWVDEEDAALADVAVSTVVQSTNRVPVVVERAMWWRSYGQRWTEGHNSPGSTRFGSKWAVADVRSGGASNDETYVLIANTSYFPTQIVAHLTSEDGRTSKREFQIAARSRFNISVGAHFPELAGTRGSMVIDDPSGLSSLVVECSIYSDAGVERWAAGANLVATVLR
jgi:hypothetical protein